jgi:hypothetical protein
MYYFFPRCVFLTENFRRTFDGFQVLIEKDWISFGHAFLMRSGHLLNSKEDEISPVFLQFLDCVYQLVRQFPHYFEFGPRYILTIADHIYSCRFGTFLMNCDADRVSYCCPPVHFIILIMTHISLISILSTFPFRIASVAAQKREIFGLICGKTAPCCAVLCTQTHSSSTAPPRTCSFRR